MKNENVFKIKSSRVSGFINIHSDNPRNSEGSFLTLNDGRIAFAYSRYSGESDNDHAPCDICIVYSGDGGKTFDTENPQVLVYATDYNEQNVMSVTLRYMNNGEIGLFYLLKHSNLTSEYRLRRYKGDFSVCLSDVKCLPLDFEGYFVVNNDRVFRTSQGKWIVPAAFHPTYTNADGTHLDGRGTVYFFTSEDDGCTWTQNSAALRLDDPYSRTLLQEPGLAEWADGTLYCYSRTDRMYQYEALSSDSGKSWTYPRPSKFTSPTSPLLIKRNPYSGLYYAVWNPVPVSFGHPEKAIVWGRTPLVMARSSDGINFSNPAVLEADPDRGFCYPAMEFVDEKTILLAYCSGGKEDGCCLNRTTLRQVIIK